MRRQRRDEERIEEGIVRRPLTTQHAEIQLSIEANEFRIFRVFLKCEAVFSDVLFIGFTENENDSSPFVEELADTHTDVAACGIGEKNPPAADSTKNGKMLVAHRLHKCQHWSHELRELFYRHAKTRSLITPLIGNPFQVQ